MYFFLTAQAIIQVLNSHMQPVVTILDGAESQNISIL